MVEMRRKSVERCNSLNVLQNVERVAAPATQSLRASELQHCKRNTAPTPPPPLSHPPLSILSLPLLLNLPSLQPHSLYLERRVNHQMPTDISSKPPTTATIPLESSGDPAAAPLPWWMGECLVRMHAHRDRCARARSHKHTHTHTYTERACAQGGQARTHKHTNTRAHTHTYTHGHRQTAQQPWLPTALGERRSAAQSSPSFEP